MTYDELVERTVSIIHDVYDLKEDVLNSGTGVTVQPQFDAGMLDAALTIIKASVDNQDQRIVAELERQLQARLQRALNAVINEERTKQTPEI